MSTRSQQAEPQPPVFDLYGPQIDADPFPYYRRLRDEFPCYWHERNGIWIVSRYEDVLAAAQNWRTFSSSDGNMVDELPGRAGATLGTTDPPRHDRLRALTRVAFGRRSLSQLEAPTRALAAQALREIPASRHIDFVTDFASKVTVGVLFQLLGLPPQDPADIRRMVVLSISTNKSLRGRNEEGHLGFGAGPHFCLGNSLARLVTTAAMEEFLRAAPEFHLTSRELRWISSSNFRSPVALPFDLSQPGG